MEAKLTLSGEQYTQIKHALFMRGVELKANLSIEKNETLTKFLEEDVAKTEEAIQILESAFNKAEYSF